MAQETTSGNERSDTGRDTTLKASGEAGFLVAGYSPFDDTGRDNPATRCRLFVCRPWCFAANDTGHDSPPTVTGLLWRHLYRFIWWMS